MMVLNKIINKWWFRWLIVGVIIRLILMPITLHPDLWGHSFAAHFFAYEGKINIYEHLLNLGQEHPLVRNFGVSDIFIYPPLTYFTLGFFRLLVRPFADANFIPWVMENLGQVNLHKGLFWHLFLFKLPYLFIDIFLAFVLSSFFNEPKKKKFTFVLWMLNPITLYATFMIGQLDIIPVLFTVLSIYFAYQNKTVCSMLSLGVGASYKTYPLFLVPVAAFVLAKNFGERIRLIFYGVLPYLVTIMPFLISAPFRSMVLFSPKSQKMLFMIWNISGAEGIYPFLVILFLIYFYAWFSDKKIKLHYYFLTIFLLIFSVAHYHPQWFLWITPFLLLELVENNFKYLVIILTLLCSWAMITIFFEPSLSFGLFNPVFPGLQNSIGLAEIVGWYTNVFQIKSMIRSIFTGASLYYVFSLFNIKNKETK